MSSSDSLEKAIDKYQYETSTSSSGSSSSDGGNSTDEEYVFGVLGFPLEAIQQEIRKASGSQAGTSSNISPSIPLSVPLDEEEVTVFSCAIDIPSKIDKQRLDNLRAWYQIPDELNPRLPVHGEWCCDPRLG